VTEAGLAEVEHKLWPLASLKGVEERKRKRKAKRGQKTDAHY
jgi:hypothetical protein